MKLSEIKTVDEKLPFDLEVALTAFKNGKKLNLVDAAFGDGRKTLTHAQFNQAGDLILTMHDPDASFSPRLITYPQNSLHGFHLDTDDTDELTLFMDVDKL